MPRIVKVQHVLRIEDWDFDYSFGLDRMSGGEQYADYRHQASQLARHCAGQGIFHHPPALRPDRSRHRQELETRRHRSGEVTFVCRCRR
jgi:hypothetical protein